MGHDLAETQGRVGREREVVDVHEARLVRLLEPTDADRATELEPAGEDQHLRQMQAEKDSAEDREARDAAAIPKQNGATNDLVVHGQDRHEEEGRQDGSDGHRVKRPSTCFAGAHAVPRE